MSNVKLLKVSNNTEKESEEQFIIMLNEYKQDTDGKTTKLSEDFKTMFAVL